MNYKNNKKHITALLAAMAVAGGTSVARAQFFPFDDAVNFNSSSSFSSTVTQLNELNVGTLPDGIKTVVDNLNGYLASEQGKNGDLVTFRDDKQANVAAQEALIEAQNTLIGSKVGLINTLIASNPLDAQIAIEQENLATMQSDLGTMTFELGTKNEALNAANSDVTNSDIKIALYKQAINVPVANAQKAASDAAAVIVKAQDQFASGGVLTSPDATATGSTGLQGVIDTINGVTAGDQFPVVAAIQDADTTFAGIGADNASVADIQALVGAINTNLPALPPISVDDKDAALFTVLNGSYERNAIDTIQSSGIAGIVHRDPVTGAVHIGENSLITNEVGGVQELYAQDAGANPININVTNGSGLLLDGVSVATVANVADEASRATAAEGVLTTNLAKEVTDRIADVNAEEGARIAADNVLTTNLNNEVTRATTAEGVLTTNLAKEVTDRIADVNAEEAARIAAVTAEANTRAAADTQLQANITAEASRATAAEGVLTTNLTKEVADRVAAVNTEKTRALAAESALADRSTALEGRATALEGRVGRAEGRINSLRKGVSMAAALQTPIIEAGKQNAVKAGVATVDGAQGFGIAVARRINESVQVNLDVATDFETDTAARAGVNYSF